MSHFKSFLLGIVVAYGVYYLTRRGADGCSVLDELLENPKDFMVKAKNYAIADLVEIVKEKVK